MDDAPDVAAPGEPASTTAPARVALGAPLAAAAAVLVADQITKTWAQSALGDGHTVPLLGSLRLNLTYNSGMAFSRGRGLGPVIGVLALVLVVVMLASLRREGSRLARIALGLVIGGAAGNIADRLFRGGGLLRGRVIDFIDAQWWPVFNVADVAVSVGGALLVLGALRAGTRAQPASNTPDPAPERPEAGVAGPHDGGTVDESNHVSNDDSNDVTRSDSNDESNDVTSGDAVDDERP